MAIVKLGAPVSGIRGTVGGVTYSANKSGAYVKQWAAPPKPIRVQTAQQQGWLGSLPGEWRAMSQALRDAWDVWAALGAQEKTNSLGEAYYCSGWNWFVELNLNCYLVGRATQTAVPVIAKPAAPTYTLILEATGVGADSRVTYGAGEFSPDYDLVLYLDLVSSQGRAVWPLPYRFVHYNRNPIGTEESIQASLDGVYGAVAVGQRGFAAMQRGTSEGYRSAVTVEYEDAV